MEVIKCDEQYSCDTAGIFNSETLGYYMSRRDVNGDCVTECMLPILEVSVRMSCWDGSAELNALRMYPWMPTVMSTVTTITTTILTSISLMHLIITTVITGTIMTATSKRKSEAQSGDAL